jgi:acetyl-CoA carboxylase carboxyl transferase subunit alpha
MAVSVKRALSEALRQVVDLKPKELLLRRHERLKSYGRFTDTRDR